MTLPQERTGVGWSQELTAAYVGAEAPPAAACNSALLEVVAIADRLVAGTVLMGAAYASWSTPTRAVPGQDLPSPVVGEYLNAADLTGSEYRTTMALALAQVGREIKAGTGRQAGVIILAPGLAAGIVAACVLVGVAVGWYAAGGSTASQADRVRHAGLAEAGRLASERVRVAAETGHPIAPPGPIELAAAEDIRTAARQARDAGIGQHIDEAVGTIGKVALFLGVLWGGVQLFGSSWKD